MWISAITVLFILFFQVNAKYSEELAHESLEWIASITQEDIPTAGDMDNFYEVLKDGTLLCRYINRLFSRKKPNIFVPDW